MASREYNPGSGNRIKGVVAALKEAGLNRDNLQVLHGGYGFVDGEKAAEEWLKLEKRPTAIIASSDPASIGLYSVLLRNGMNVPDDVSIMGYGDSSDINLLTPALTTVAHPFVELGREVSDLLIKQIEKKAEPSRNILIPGKLIIRESCRKIT